MGPAGTDGADGIDGAMGPAGPTGPTGAAGSTGATGATGPEGPAGPQGLPGVQGSDGSDGADGVDGSPGSMGPIGPPGIGVAGPPGPGASFRDAGGTEWGVAPAKLGNSLAAVLLVDPQIVVGSTVLYGKDSSVTWDLYSVKIATGTPTHLGTGTVNSTLDHADYTASGSEYLLVLVHVNSGPGQTIFGAHVNGTTGTPIQRVTPDQFLAVD